jgi:hypothetical protein
VVPLYSIIMGTVYVATGARYVALELWSGDSRLAGGDLSSREGHWDPIKPVGCCG